MKIFSRMTSKLTGNSNGVLMAGYALIKQLYDVVTASVDQAADIADSETRYQSLKSSFSDDLRVRWHNYVRTVQILWGICFIVIAWSLFETAWLTLIQGFVMLGFVWICLGYRIWVLRERKYPPFGQYLKMVLKTPKSALPLQTQHLMD